MHRLKIASERLASAATVWVVAALLALPSTSASAQSRRPQPAPQPDASPAPSSTPLAAAPRTPGPQEAPNSLQRRATPQAQPDSGAEGADTGGSGTDAVQDAAPPDSNAPRTIMPRPLQLPPADEAGPSTSVISATRRPGGEKTYKIVANQAKVKDFVKFIAEVTGKSVIPRLGTAGETSITIVSDREVTEKEALDLLFQAFRINNIAVVETDRYVFIDMMSEVLRLGPHPVLGPEVDISSLNEDGQWVFKFFKIQNTKADALASRITELPDSVTLTPDPNSNQLQFFGDLATAKRVQRMVQLLDVPAFVDVQTKTFRLQYADASQVANLITELFASRGGAGAGGVAAAQAQRAQQPPRAGAPAQRAPTGGGELVGTSEQLLVSVIPAINSITVRAEPSIMHEIERLITTAWDVNPSSGGQIFKYYDLKYTDPLKVREVLGALLESGGGSAARAGAGGRAGLGAGVVGRAQVGGGGESGADVAVANIFRIEAYPDSNRLLVISKTPDNFRWLDEMIDQLDQPLRVGIPKIVPLKHANAIEVAEIINALLAPAGSDVTITAPDTGLSGINFQTAGGGSAAASRNAGAAAGTAGAGTPAGSGNQIRLPWMGGRGAGEGAQTEVSALVGKSRVVPNGGQNSLLILAPPEIEEALVRIITDLDVPGRQVMITAILAEVQLGDQWAYGLQFGPAGLQPPNPNNAIVISGGGDAGRMYSGSREGDFIGDLTTSVLSFGVDATVILQALDQVTNVSILQSPRVFTSDNKEAIFFDGQDIPFQTQQSNQGTAGGVTSAFEQISVGIGLNVRPRITKERNVYMDIEVLLSNQNTTSPVGVGGNPVIDRRQTNTKVTVKNGQTIVISGIRKEQRNFQKTKIPFLGDIPVLDLVFAFTNDNTVTKELVVFITPVVVDNPDENDSNFNVQERMRLREVARPLSERTADLVRGAGLRPVSDVPTEEQVAPLMPLEEPTKPGQPSPLP